MVKSAQTATKAKPRVNGRGRKKAETFIPFVKPANILIEVRQISPKAVVTHRFSEKAKLEMRCKQQALGSVKKGPKDPFQEFLGALHILPGMEKKLPKGKLKMWESWPYIKDAFGMPAVAFKAAIVNAAMDAGMYKTTVRRAIFIEADLIPFKYEKLVMREDVVRVGPSKVADLRYRPEFQNWSATLPIQYQPNILSKEQLLSLVNQAGFGIGIGEGRPQKNELDWGRFELVKVVCG